MRKIKAVYILALCFSFIISIYNVCADDPAVPGIWEDEQHTAYIVDPDVKELPERAFYKCEGLKYIIIPQTVKLMSMGSIDECNDLEYVYIGAEQVEACAIYANKALKVIDITKDTRCISYGMGDGFFVYEGGFNVIVNVEKGNPYYESDKDGVLYNKGRTRLISVPSRLKGEFRTPESVKYICDDCFINTALREISITDNVLQVSMGVFGCEYASPGFEFNLRNLFVSERLRYMLEPQLLNRIYMPVGDGAHGVRVRTLSGQDHRFYSHGFSDYCKILPFSLNCMTIYGISEVNHFVSIDTSGKRLVNFLDIFRAIDEVEKYEGCIREGNPEIPVVEKRSVNLSVRDIDVFISGTDEMRFLPDSISVWPPKEFSNNVIKNMRKLSRVAGKRFEFVVDTESDQEMGRLYHSPCIGQIIQWNPDIKFGIVTSNAKEASKYFQFEADWEPFPAMVKINPRSITREQEELTLGEYLNRNVVSK